MREIRSSLPAPRRTFDRRIIGTPEQVRNAIQRIQSSGRLVHASPWRETPEGVTVTVRILDQPAQPTPAPRVRRRRWPIAAAAASVATVSGVAVYALVRLVDAVIDALPVIFGALLLLALVAVLSKPGRSVACVTFHGPGCHRH